MCDVSHPQEDGSTTGAVKRKRQNPIKALCEKLLSRHSNWQPTSEPGGNPIMQNPKTYIPELQPVALPWHSIETNNDSVLVFCGEQCLNSYTINILADDEHYVSQKTAPKIECIYCHWCSIRIYEPQNCFSHGAKCPTFSWKYSHQAIECYAELTRLFPGHPIPAEVLDDVEELADVYGPDLPGQAIARIAHHSWDFFE
jgi:hypothetical protein